MSSPASTVKPFAAQALSGHLDTRTAASEVAEKLREDIGEHCDLVVMFASYHHVAAFMEAAATIRNTVNPTTMIGTTTEGVVGGDEECEGIAGLSTIAFRLPDVTLQPWISTPKFPIQISKPDTIPERIGLQDDTRATFILADPFSVPVTRLVPALTNCRGKEQPVTIIGGIASGSSQPSGNMLMIDDQFLNGGAVGVSLSGKVTVDCVVSQGCRPFGNPLVITKVDGTTILELGGKPAFTVLQETTASLPEEQRELLKKGVLIGTVINEYRERFGRGDFLIRNIMGINQETKAIATSDHPNVGQTIQFHIRDGETASEDLALLLDAEQLKPRPFGALLFTCNGRGKRLFGESHHDVQMIRQRLKNVPLSGFFAAGEIGPIGNQSFVHGHTAVAALFRPGKPF